MSRLINNCNVCVIGGAGFLGSHLVRYLAKDRGCNVLILDNLITGTLSNITDHYTWLQQPTFVWYDIRDDENELTRLLKQYNIEFVFNYAAEPYIPECFERPLHFFDINAVAVLKVLNACQKAEVKGILQVSSAEIYGDMSGKIKETDPICPHSTYGVSKVAADGLVQVRWKESGVPAIALRQFNCVGERETHEYVIPEIITQLDRQLDNQQPDKENPDEPSPVVYLGNNSTRDFMYAGDAVAMAVELLEHGYFGEVYNMGSQSYISIYDLAHVIAAVMGFKYSPEIKQDPKRIRPWEIWHLQSDNTKLYQTIPSRPTVDLEEALKRTVEYYWDNDSRWSYEKNSPQSLVPLLPSEKFTGYSPVTE